MSELGEISRTVPFTEDYIRICFQYWFNTGCKGAKEFVKDKDVPVDEYGRTPSAATITHWMKEREWRIRADELNAKAHLLADKDLVSAKARMLRKQAENAVKIQEKALGAMLSEGFDSSAAAVNAYFRATEEERKAKGIGDLIERLSEMSNDKLQQKILELSARASGGDVVIDVAPIDADTESKEE